AAFHAGLGRADALAPMHAAWARGDRRAAAAGIPAVVIDDLFVHGTPQECREHLDRFAAAGVTTLLLEVLPGIVDPVVALCELALRRRLVKVTYPPDAEEFRADVRAWLHAHLPAGWFDNGFQLDAESRREFLESWNRAMYEDGWICAQWPREYGGGGRWCAGGGRA